MKLASTTPIVEVKTILCYSKTKSYFEFVRVFADGKEQTSFYNHFETLEKNLDKIKDQYPNVVCTQTKKTLVDTN